MVSPRLQGIPALVPGRPLHSSSSVLRAVFPCFYLPSSVLGSIFPCLKHVFTEAPPALQRGPVVGLFPRQPELAMSGVEQPLAPLTESSASAWAQLPDTLLQVELERLGKQWHSLTALTVQC